MAILIVNDKERRVEYVAQPGETIFVYDWEIFKETDLQVFKDKLPLTFSNDYTVTNAGITGGGDVVLNVAAVGGEEIVINSNLAIDQTVDFTIKSNFVGETVQLQFDKLTMIAQELDTKLGQRGLLYNVFDDLKIENQDNILPQLAASQFWQMNSVATGIFAAEFEIDPGANTLRSELISAQSGSDGAKIVGYFSQTLGETTVKDQLDALDTPLINKFKNLIFGGDFSTNPSQRGDTFTSPVVNNTFVADRFKYSSTEPALQLGTTLPTPVGLNIAQTGIFVRRSLRFTVTSGFTPAATDLVGVEYKVEGFDWAKIFGRNFTFSFWMFTTVPGTYSVSFASTTETWVTEITQAAATWTKHEITVTPGSDLGNGTNGVGLDIFITYASGATEQTATLDQWFASGSKSSSTNQVNGVNASSDVIEFALFQLEPGDKATGFGIRTFEEELALCQRYFSKTYDVGTRPGTPSALQGRMLNFVPATGLGNLAGFLRFDAPVRLRATPLVEPFSSVTGSSGDMRNLTLNQDQNAIVERTGEIINIVVSSVGGQAFGTSFEGHMTLNAEL